jgi:hypothetical protein
MAGKGKACCMITCVDVDCLPARDITAFSADSAVKGETQKDCNAGAFMLKWEKLSFC